MANNDSNSLQVVYKSVATIKTDPSLEGAVPVLARDRKRLEQELEVSGKIEVALVVSSDNYVLDGYGRLSWAKGKHLSQVPVTVRHDLNFEQNPKACVRAALAYNDARRQLGKLALLKVAKQKARLDKQLDAIKAKLSAAGKKGAAMRKGKKGADPGAPEGVAGSPTNGEGSPETDFSKEKVRQALKVEDEFKAGRLPVGELQVEGLVSTGLAYRVFKAGIDAEVQTAIVAEVRALPAEEQRKYARDRLTALIPKKSSKKTPTDTRPIVADELATEAVVVTSDEGPDVLIEKGILFLIEGWKKATDMDTWALAPFVKDRLVKVWIEAEAAWIDVADQVAVPPAGEAKKSA